MEQKPFNVYEDDIEDYPELTEYVQPQDLEHCTQTDLVDKLRRCGYVLLKKQTDLKNLEEQSAPILEQLEKRKTVIKDKLASAEADIDRFKDFVKVLMKLADTANIKAPEFTLYKKVTPKVNIDIRMTPDKAPGWAVKSKLEFDKKAIKEHIQSTGEIVEGISLADSESIILKQ